MSAISKEYAQSLFSLAKEAGNLDEVFEGIKLLNEVLTQNKEYFQLLSSPAIERQERLDLLNKAVGNALPEYVSSFAAVLVTNGHISEFFECAKDFQTLYDNEKNLATAYVRSAVELNGDDKEKLTEKLTKLSGKTVTLQTEVDKSLIGGIVVELDGKVYDGSLKQKLKTAKEVMGK